MCKKFVVHTIAGAASVIQPGQLFLMYRKFAFFYRNSNVIAEQIGVSLAVFAMSNRVMLFCHSGKIVDNFKKNHSFRDKV